MTERTPNPYTLGPIKRRDRLAGRSGELKEIEYYLELAQAGQSPHLALIGQRGVGKTSLLRAASELADAHCLLPVSIDLNESKVQSAGAFWHDLYSTLTLAAANAGCWGGVTGPIYSSLLSQLYQRETVDLEYVVLQFPLTMARHVGDLDRLLCPDALIVHDWEAVRKELQQHGLRGIALLLDEGDCLGVKRGLLQMLRNVLQRVEGTCFVITGTEALFDVVSDVFSPIPRQFHRLDVARFPEWTETLELIKHPIPERLRPSIATAVELHEVCQGDPTELQLYCHHMYKAIDEGLSEKMELTPGVYRAVRAAYRAHSQAVDVKVLNAIDELSDELLVESRWLRRRRLNLEENTELERLRRELRDGRTLSADSRRRLCQEVAAGYEELHSRGISASSTSLELIGGAATAGYWKSLVQTERTRRWAWVDDGFAPLVRRTVAGALSQMVGRGTVRGEVGEEEISATQALENLRAGGEFRDVSKSDLSRLMLACVGAREEKSDKLVDISYLLEHQRVTRVRVSYAGSDPAQLRKRGEAWLAERREVLREHGMAVSIENIEEVRGPSNREVSRLAHAAKIVPPGDIFGLGLFNEAIALFFEGDLGRAVDLFAVMLRDRDDPAVRNNLAYCLMAMGQGKEALGHIQRAARDENALREHNLGVAEALNRDIDAARKTLRHAWKMQDANPHSEDVLCMLLVSKDYRSVSSIRNIPLTAALLTNMLTIGAEDERWCTESLSTRYGEQYQQWLGMRPE